MSYKHSPSKWWRDYEAECLAWCEEQDRRDGVVERIMIGTDAIVIRWRVPTWVRSVDP